MYPGLKLHFALCDIAPCNRESCYTSIYTGLWWWPSALFWASFSLRQGLLNQETAKDRESPGNCQNYTGKQYSTCVQRAAESGNLLWVFPQNLKINFEEKNWSFKEQFCWPWVICRSSFFAGHQAVCVQFSDRDPHQERCFLSSRQGSAWQDHSSGKHK